MKAEIRYHFISGELFATRRYYETFRDDKFLKYVETIGWKDRELVLWERKDEFGRPKKEGEDIPKETWYEQDEGRRPDISEFHEDKNEA